jgi:hypothetical protein
MDPQQRLTRTRASAAPFPTHARTPTLTVGARTIVIVGAGFSGTAVAIHLLRLPHSEPLRIVLVERAQLAGGVAYARREQPYLLSVPAARMSASSADPLEFLEYAQRTLPHATGADFLPRELYGEYLESSLRSAALASPPHVRLEHVHREVIAIERAHRTSALQVYLENGGRIMAHSVAATVLVDRVVNCTGPQYDARHTRERLLRSLLSQGMVVSDSLGLGITTDEFGAVVDASGCVAANLYYTDPCCVRGIGRLPPCRSCAHTPKSSRAIWRCRRDRGRPLDWLARPAGPLRWRIENFRKRYSPRCMSQAVKPGVLEDLSPRAPRQ